MVASQAGIGLEIRRGLRAQSLAGLLYFGAALGVLPLVLKEKTFNWPWQAGRSTFFFLSGAILLGGIMGPLLLLLGLRATNAGDVSLWLNLEFVATVILGHFVFREHLSARGWIAAFGTLIASVLLVKIEGGNGVVPFLLIASGCLCWGFDNHHRRDLSCSDNFLERPFCRGV